MRNIAVYFGWIACALALASIKAPELDAPLSHGEEEGWDYIPGRSVSLYLHKEERTQKILRFCVEEKESGKSLLFSLDDPKGEGEVITFLQNCSRYIDPYGRSHVTIIATSPSLIEKVMSFFPKYSEDVLEPLARESVKKEPFSCVAAKGSENFLRISYEFPYPKIETARDLRKLWNLALIQYMTKERFSEGGLYKIESESNAYLLPSTTIECILGTGSLSEGIVQVLGEVDRIRRIGFTIEELSRAKAVFLEKIRGWQATKNFWDLEEIVTFHAEGFLKGLRPLAQAEFLHFAKPLIESITPVDIAIGLENSFSDNDRHMTLYMTETPETSATRALIEELVQAKSFLGGSPINGGAEGSSSPLASRTKSFYDLTITDYDKEIIYKIIDTMAKDNVIKLGLKRKSMERKGKKIRPVHPFRFLAHIFGDSYLRSCMQEISRSSFKWNGFIDGLSERIQEEVVRDNVVRHIPGFCEYLHRDEQEVMNYVQKRDWEGLVRFLL